MPEPINEVTFVARLGTTTGLRAHKRHEAAEPVLIESGEVEERQIDPESGRYKRCDIRLNAVTGRKLASGEMKRPEVPEGRDVTNEALVNDARRKAIARGLPYYFTCNMAEIALFSVASRQAERDKLEKRFKLAPVKHSKDVEAYWEQIEAGWVAFLDDLEGRLVAVDARRPSVTTADVIALRDTIDAVAEEAIERAIRQVSEDDLLAQQIRDEAETAFGFAVALDAKGDRATYRSELLQVLRLGIFVIAQKLVLHRVLSEIGPKRAEPFSLDDVPAVGTSTDPEFVRQVFHSVMDQAIKRSGDYETAFRPETLEDAVFLDTKSDEEVEHCRVGEVWQQLIDAVSAVSWSAISQNLVGFLYEAIVDPVYRHLLGQHYTPEDVVDVLVTFAVREPGDRVLDPASGGGSFMRSVYNRKRDLGDTHGQALEEIWAFEIAAFAAELTTITLATADTYEPAAYPRVLLRDFFSVEPGMATEMQIPGIDGTIHVPTSFHAIVGNPPYISYRRQTNQPVIEKALEKASRNLALPAFSGKSDAFAWFLVHSTRFLTQADRLAFVVSSAILFSNYGVPLIRFLSQHYRIRAVIDSAVERWFIEADTNTVLLMLEREEDEQSRREQEIRFIRFRRPLSQLLPSPGDAKRRDTLEELVEELLEARAGGDDPRFLVNVIRQGEHGGIDFEREDGPEGGTLDQADLDSAT
jgi:hypothetical protein